MSRPYAFVQYAVSAMILHTCIHAHMIPRLGIHTYCIFLQRLHDAAIALENAPGTLLDGRKIRCEQARVNRTICISSNSANVPLERDEVRIRLSSFGTIESMRMVDDPTEQGMKMYAYVKYQYRDDAIKAFLVRGQIPIPR